MKESYDKEPKEKKRLPFRLVWKLIVLAIAMIELISSGLELTKDTDTSEPVRREEEDTSRGGDVVVANRYELWDAEDLYYGEDYLQDKLLYIKEKERMLAGLGEGYEKAYRIKENCQSLVVQKEGKWGMVSVDGSVLVPCGYERVSWADKTGWVEFERNGHFFVYDSEGDLQRAYTDKMRYRMESEEGYLYRTGIGCMAGMEIMTVIPEVEGTEYYGIRYSTISPNKVIYEATGEYAEAGMYTFPDESGRAVAIRGDGVTNTIYYLTENGCESRIMELPEGINGRWFDFVVDYTWADYSLSNGWLKVMVCDAVPDFLMDKYEYYLAFLNIDTLELVRFPEEYQNFYRMANYGYGNAMAVTATEADENGYYKYAICKGDRVLTEEKYYWVEFGEKYITAGSDEAIEILDYDGTVLISYWDVGGRFVNGKMVVSDGTGVWLIDENLEACMDYYLVEGQIDGCFEHGVVIDGMYYPLKELAE